MNCSIPQLTWLSSTLMEKDRDYREIETERGRERENQEAKKEEKEVKRDDNRRKRGETKRHKHRI